MCWLPRGSPSTSSSHNNFQKEEREFLLVHLVIMDTEPSHASLPCSTPAHTRFMFPYLNQALPKRYLMWWASPGSQSVFLGRSVTGTWEPVGRVRCRALSPWSRRASPALGVLRQEGLTAEERAVRCAFLGCSSVAHSQCSAVTPDFWI